MKTPKCNHVLGVLLILGMFSACNESLPEREKNPIKPTYITPISVGGADDPAIWVNKADPSNSLILATSGAKGGPLLVYDLQGNLEGDKTINGFQGPDHVDVEYGLKWKSDSLIDIAVLAEKKTGMLRVFRVPDMLPIDNGGIPAFDGEENRNLKGLALYKRPSDGAIFAILGRKKGPMDAMFWQYHLTSDTNGVVTGKHIRTFGKITRNDFETIVVDDELGYVYFSDENTGIQKYYADPQKGNESLALFAKKGIVSDIEGMAIYSKGNGKGYILALDEEEGSIHLFPREGTANNPHDHPLIEIIDMQAVESDGIEVTSIPTSPEFPNGLLVAMSLEKAFHLYDWRLFGVGDQ